MEYDNTNRGVLFRNDKKETESHPDRNGSINIEGTDYWLSGWLKKSKAGNQFLSLSAKRKDAPAREPGSNDDKRAAVFDDDLPF